MGQNHLFWALEGATAQTKQTLVGSKVAYHPANTFPITPSGGVLGGIKPLSSYTRREIDS